MDCDAAIARNVARDWVGVFWIAALGESDGIVFGIFHAHFAGMVGGRVVRLGSLFVGLPNFVLLGLALVGLRLFLRGFVYKALVIGAEPSEPCLPLFVPVMAAAFLSGDFRAGQHLTSACFLCWFHYAMIAQRHIAHNSFIRLYAKAVIISTPNQFIFLKM